MAENSNTKILTVIRNALKSWPRCRGMSTFLQKWKSSIHKKENVGTVHNKIFTSLQFFSFTEEGLAVKSDNDTRKNFKQVLKLRLQDISLLSSWLDNTWTSHDIQNALICNWMNEPSKRRQRRLPLKFDAVNSNEHRFKCAEEYLESQILWPYGYNSRLKFLTVLSYGASNCTWTDNCLLLNAANEKNSSAQSKLIWSYFTAGVDSIWIRLQLKMDRELVDLTPVSVITL